MEKNNPYREFSKIVSNTLCPFSDQKSIMGPKWDNAISFEKNIHANAIELEEFFKFFIRDQIHGYVMEIRFLNPVVTLNSFSLQFCKILTELSRYDPSHSTCLSSEIEDQKWQYEFCGERTFITSFAPCYSTNHPRYSYSNQLAYLFFQPEKSFSFCGVNSSNRKLKIKTRERFRKAGRPYDGDLIDKRIEAWLYILPENIGDTPVKWWEMLE